MGFKIHLSGGKNEVTFSMMENGEPILVTKDIEELTPGERQWIINQVKVKDVSETEV